MKRLLNQYGVNRADQIYVKRRISRGLNAMHEMALWTILEIRWPTLAAYLASSPDAIDEVRTSKPSGGVPDGLRSLVERDSEVIDVLDGHADGVHARLTPAGVRFLFSDEPGTADEGAAEEASEEPERLPTHTIPR